MYDAIARTIGKAIALFAPEYATQYLKNHNLVRAYAAARAEGTTRNFRPPRTSGAQEISASWQNVTNKTRALQRDNSHVAGMGRRFVAALVGEGSWPRPKVLKKKAADNYDYDAKVNLDILSRWELLAPEACSNGDSIYQLQRVAAHHFFFDGGLLIRKVIINGKLRFQPIELDYLDTSKDMDNVTERIVGGRKLDIYNKPVSYWIKTRHPSELATNSIEVPADEIIDLFDRGRASEVGGISRLAPSVLNFHNIGTYRSDTMKLAKTATGFGIAVETENPADYLPPEGAEKDENDVDLEFITPGGIHYMRPGEKINVIKPEIPGTTYEPFLRAELRSASVGAGMSYESVSNDGSQTNFSGSRQMMLFERAMMRYTFAIFEEKFYAKIYRWFIEHELDFGGLKLPGYNSSEKAAMKFLRVSWSRPKTEWVDPLKDAKAAKEEIAMGGNTVTEFCETAGRDFEEVTATQAYEERVRKAAGLPSLLVEQPAEAPRQQEQPSSDDTGVIKDE